MLHAKKSIIEEFISKLIKDFPESEMAFLDDGFVLTLKNLRDRRIYVIMNKSVLIFRREDDNRKYKFWDYRTNNLQHAMSHVKLFLTGKK